MGLRYARSARRHGISEARAAFVIHNCPSPLYPRGDPETVGFVLYLGPDANGIPLEIGVIELVDDELLVIHAMRLRPQYSGDYEQVMRWHAR